MTTWKLAVLVGAATAATVTGLALALDGDETRGRDHAAPAAMVAERGDDLEGPAGPRGAMHELMQDPEFREDLWSLREEQQTAMREWWDTYADDPTSDRAKDALDEVLDAQRAAMSELMEKYGVGWDDRAGDAGTLRGLMVDEEFRDELWALQDKAEAAVQSWWDHYGDDPASDEAREARQELRDEQLAKLTALLEKYGVELDDGPLTGRGGGPLGDLLGGGPLGDDLLGGPFGGGRGGMCGPEGTGGPGGMMAPRDDGAGSDSSPATQTGATL